MIKKFFIVLYIFTTISITASQTITIGIVPPYMVNNSAETIFYNKNFTFELLFYYKEENFLFEIINTESLDKENEYLVLCKQQVIDENYDYLLYSKVAVIEKNLIFIIKLINPYNNKIVLTKTYKKYIDFTIPESLSECTTSILNILHSLELQNAEDKFLFTKKDKETDNNQIEESNERKKHEVFVLNGFFKNHSNIISFLEICTGYNFSPFDFFSIEGAIFLGGGYINNNLYLNNINITNFYIGTYASFYFFISGPVEPSIGLRFELTYIHLDTLYFTFPIDIGLKINIKKNNSIRINATMQFMSLNFLDFKWKDNFILGFLIGYAKKI